MTPSLAAFQSGEDAIGETLSAQPDRGDLERWPVEIVGNTLVLTPRVQSAGSYHVALGSPERVISACTFRCVIAGAAPAPVGFDVVIQAP